jgi:hypothetical protein
MKKTFENQWKEAFQEADIQAPEGSWEWIEEKLDAKKRRPFLFLWTNANVFKLAAGIILLLGIGSYIYFQKAGENTEIAVNKNLPKKPEVNSSTASPSENTIAKPAENIAHNSVEMPEIFTAKRPISRREDETVSTQKSEIAFPDEVSNTTNTITQSEVENVTQTSINQSENSIAENNLGNNRERISITQNSFSLAILTPIELEKINVKTIQKREFLPVEEQDDLVISKTKSNKSWIGIQTGVSPFSPSYNTQTLASAYAVNLDNSSAYKTLNTVGGAPGMELAYANSPAEQFSNGNSANFGLELGKKIRKRWMLGAIVRISNAKINQKTNVFAFDKQTGRVNSYFQANYLDKVVNNKQVLTSIQTENTQSFRYLQVPFYISYQLPVLSILELEFQTGISSDIFLGSKIKGDIIDDEQFTVQNSKYKALNFSGFAGLGLNLKLSQNWRAVVQGNFQKALFSGTKGELDFKPRFMGVNYGLRYVL